MSRSTLRLAAALCLFVAAAGPALAADKPAGGDAGLSWTPAEQKGG